MKIDFLARYDSVRRIIGPPPEETGDTRDDPLPPERIGRRGAASPVAAESPRASGFAASLAAAERPARPDPPRHPGLPAPVAPRAAPPAVRDTAVRDTAVGPAPLVRPDDPPPIAPEIPSPPPGRPAAPELLDARRHAPHDVPGMVAGLVDDEAARYRLAPELGLAVIRAESSFDPRATSRDGHATKGLFQLKDDTGRELLGRLSPGEAYEPYDPELNVKLGMGYLRRLHDLFGTDTTLTRDVSTRAAGPGSLEKLAVAAFNAGEGRVAAAQAAAERAGLDPSSYEAVADFLPGSTKRYVSRVTGLKEEYAAADVGRTPPRLKG